MALVNSLITVRLLGKPHTSILPTRNVNLTFGEVVRGVLPAVTFLCDKSRENSIYIFETSWKGI